MLRLRTSIPLAAVLLAAAALAAPPAYAIHGPGEGVASSRAHLHMLDNYSGMLVERLGPKYLSPTAPVRPVPAPVVREILPRGFDWTDASVGAGVAAAALTLIGLGALVLTRRGSAAAAPDETTIVGT